MAFDQSTRNRLQRFVNEARKVQEEEFTRQLQNDYGLDPTSGTITPLENLRHISTTRSGNRADSARHPGPLLRQPGSRRPNGPGAHRARAGFHGAQPSWLHCAWPKRVGC
ncbi:MAG: hypothetical protein V5B36_16355 [Candidatus Accumulibacter sp. UW25]|jgi:hypothetical protein